IVKIAVYLLLRKFVSPFLAPWLNSLASVQICDSFGLQVECVSFNNMFFCLYFYPSYVPWSVVGVPVFTSLDVTLGFYFDVLCLSLFFISYLVFGSLLNVFMLC
ncbi:hypothetical protein VIGAN_01031500, partial [Vigna angularis var. angularis]